MELKPHEFREKDDGNTSGSEAETIEVCKHLKTGRGCEWGANCQWLHDDSPGELRRARKVRAARSAPKQTIASGVHAQFWDPDAPSSEGTWGPWEPQR